MIRVAISGACGRMGAGLIRLVTEADDLELAAALERPGHPMLGRDIGTIPACGLGGVVGCAVTDRFDGQADVLVDFSEPAGAVARARECAEAGVPLVSGTTGLSEVERASVEEAARRIPCLRAANMSVGVNVLLDIAREVASRLGDEYDVEIVEVHHRFKKDAPSGTALALAEQVAKGLGRNVEECLVHGRRGAVGARETREIGMHSVRAGDIVGDHTVIFSSLGERIELVHRAHTRETFMRGALRATRFIVGKPPGLYSMRDVLQEGLKSP